MKFLDAHSLGTNIARLKAKSLCGIGQCLRALAFHCSPDAPTQWTVTDMVGLIQCNVFDRCYNVCALDSKGVLLM